MKFIHSFRFRLIYYFAGVTTVTIIVFAIMYINAVNSSIKSNFITNSRANLSYITDTIDANLQSAGLTTLWFDRNKELIRLLSLKEENTSSFINSQLALQRTFTDQITNAIMGNYMLSVNIVGENGMFLNSGSSNYSISKQNYIDSAILKELLDDIRPNMQFNKVIKSEFPYSSDFKYVIPIILPITNGYSHDVLGTCTVLFDEKIISDVFSRYIPNSYTAFYVVNENGLCIASSDSALTNTIIHNDYIGDVIAAKSGYFETGNGSNKKLILFNTCSYQLTIVQEMHLSPMLSNNKILTSTILYTLTVIFIITILLYIALSKKLVSPINLLLLKMNDIANGDFHSKIKATTNDELGVLEDGIDKMALQIESFIDQKVLQEMEKKELEISVLQNQINPHFLYNTLNSIQFMANTQKAVGISRCVSALARLLRSVSKHQSKEITLENELSLLEDYFFIQRIRYNGNIEMEIIVDDDALLRCYILKFTLQPIIENAIFHGIEPTERPGKITLNIMEDHEDIVITILDDGIGMDGAELNSLFIKQPKLTSAFTSVGVKNVHERIQLMYGSSYGLSYQSKKSEYTKAIIRIPKIEGDANAKSSDN